MRKVILGICVAALLVSVAGAAMADATGAKVFLQFKAGWLTGTAMSQTSTSSFGASTSVGTSNGSVSSTAYNLGASDGVSTGWITDKVASSTTGYTFTMVVAPGTGTAVSDHAGDPHAGMCFITGWNLDSWTGTTGHTLPDNWFVTVSGSRIVGGPFTFTKAQMFLAATPAAAAINPNVGFWYDYSGANGHYSDYASAVTAGQLFTITVGPAAPEPGSILALGSGLIGLAGFAIRRRRA